MKLNKLNMIIAFALVVSGCGGGGGSSGSTSTDDAERDGTFEYVRLDDGRISEFVYQAPWWFPSESVSDELPNGVTQTVTFDPPVTSKEGRFVTLEPNTMIRLSQGEAAVDAGLTVRRIGMHEWNFDEPYFGSDFDGNLQAVSVKRSPPHPYIQNARNNNTTEGWFLHQIIFWEEHEGITTREMVVVDSGTAFDIDGVSYIRTGDDDSGEFGYIQNPHLKPSTFLPETFDANLLVENSPWYSYISTLSGNQCGRSYNFFTDGSASVDILGESFTGQYELDSGGGLRIFGDGIQTIESVLSSLSHLRWISSFPDLHSETAYAGPANGIETVISILGTDCGFQ